MKRNNCPVCGRPRSRTDFSHGECFIKKAKDDDEHDKESAGIPGMGDISIAQVRKSKNNKSKKKYAKGNLPKWMYD